MTTFKPERTANNHQISLTRRSEERNTTTTTRKKTWTALMDFRLLTTPTRRQFLSFTLERHGTVIKKSRHNRGGSVHKQKLRTLWWLIYADVKWKSRVKSPLRGPFLSSRRHSGTRKHGITNSVSAALSCAIKTQTYQSKANIQGHSHPVIRPLYSILCHFYDASIFMIRLKTKRATPESI